MDVVKPKASWVAMIFSFEIVKLLSESFKFIPILLLTLKGTRSSALIASHKFHYNQNEMINSIFLFEIYKSMSNVL